MAIPSPAKLVLEGHVQDRPGLTTMIDSASDRVASTIDEGMADQLTPPGLAVTPADTAAITAPIDPTVIHPTSVKPHGVGRLIAWGAIGALLLAGLGVGVYLALDTIAKQRADIAVLVTDLAVTRLDRDDLLTMRDRLTAERDQRTGERDTQRTRAEVAENTVSDQTTRLLDATQRIAVLQQQADASQAEVKRLTTDLSTLRARLQSVQGESRDASATASALATARDTQQRLSNAGLKYANAESDLARTRDQMIGTLNDQIAAERAGLWTTSNRLVAEYNRLVKVHNQQVDLANSALTDLKRLL